MFDSEALARDLAACPLPVITGLGHEDDLTIADLVADYRAATPTGAIVALLPDRLNLIQDLSHQRTRLRQLVHHRLQQERIRLEGEWQRLIQLHPNQLLDHWRQQLQQRHELLQALSPQLLLQRCFALVRRSDRRSLRSVQQLRARHRLKLEPASGRNHALASATRPG